MTNSSRMSSKIFIRLFKHNCNCFHLENLALYTRISFEELTVSHLVKNLLDIFNEFLCSVQWSTGTQQLAVLWE